MLVLVGCVAAVMVTAWTAVRLFQGWSSSSGYEKLKGQHVLITGGSSGIGLEVAKMVACYGAKMTIVSRSEEKLEEAKNEILRHAALSTGQSVTTLSLDVTSSDTKYIEAAFNKVVEKQGPVYMLVNCAGSSIPGTLETLTVSQIRFMMDLNFFGSAYVTKALLPGMKANGGGKIVFVSSLAGLVGVFGLTAYSASKFAVRGFAESLAAEVSPYNITVTVNCPPDTDTPGFKEEELLKPLETTLMSESAGLFKPDVVARSIIDDALAGRFLGSVGSEGFMLTNLCIGMGPSSAIEVVKQVMVMGLCRLIAWGYTLHFDKIIKKVAKMKNSGKKAE